MAFCHCSDVALAVSVFQILTLQSSPFPTKRTELGSFYSSVLPVCLPPWLGTQFSPPFGHLCVVIMYRGPAWPQGRPGGLFCPLVLLPQCSYLVYLRGHALEQGLSPTSLHNILALPTHAPSLYSQASALSHQQPHLSPVPSTSLGKGSSLELQGWNPMFTFSSVSAPPHAAL